MKKISATIRVNKPKINVPMPKKPSLGIRVTRVSGVKNPFRITR